MKRRADEIWRLSAEDPGEGLLKTACFGALIERTEFEAWLAIKAEAHLIMQAVDDSFSRDEEAQKQMLADLSDMLALGGRMRRSA